MAFRKIKAGLVNADVEQFVGEIGNLFFDIDTGILRLSDGTTPGGNIVSGGSGGGSNYTLPTATTTVKGGIKIDGITIAIDNSAVISVGTVPYNKLSGAPSVPTKVSDLTNDTGFITGVSWSQVTGKPTLFSGAYADLTGKPTAVSAFTNDSGYLTSSSLSSYATQSYVTSRGYITSSSLPTAVSQLTNDSRYLTDAEFDLNTIDYDSNNNLHATGILPGDADGFTAIFAGRAAGIAALPNTVLQSQAQVNDYAQNNFQNTYDGNHASTEWVATSPNGSDVDYYIDLGINGASWDGTASNSLYNNVGQRDGWLYVQGGNAGGGNLILGTSVANTYTKIIAGDVSTGDREVARFSSTEVKLSKQLTFGDNTTQTTAWTGSVSYTHVTDKPTLITSYNDLTDKPTLFSGAYADLSGKPTLFSGSYTDLTNKPTLFSGSYNDLTNKPAPGVSTLGGLTDVDFTTPPTIGQVLKFDGTKWAPGTDITSGGAGTDADTLDGFDSSYFLNYNNLTNKPTIPTTVTVNGTAITLGSSGTITANTTNALTVGYGLTGTASTFDGSAANTVKLDTSSTAVTATSGGTLTLSAATMTRNYVVTGGATGGTYTIKFPDLTTLNVGQQVTFYTTASLIAWTLSTGTSIITNANSGSVARATIFTVISNAANTAANLAFTALPYTGSTVGTGTALVTNNSPYISALGANSIDNSNSTLAVGPSCTAITVSATTGTSTHTLNLATAPTAATYTKTLNIGTNLNGGTGTINIGTGVTSGTSTLNIGSTSTTTTMNGAVTITSLTATNPIVGSITGNAATATKLGTARAINGVNFDGSAAITITAANPNALTIGSGLSGTSYDGSTAVTIAIDSTVALKADTHYIGTTSIALNRASASQTLTGVSIDGNAGTVTNGVYTSGTYANPAWITSLAYSKLTGTPSLFSGSYTDLTNKPTIYSSAYIGTTSLDFTRASGSQTLTGVSIDGNAATVTNGLYSTSSYANPAWLTSLAYSKLTGAPTVPSNVSQLTNDSGYITNSVTTLSSLTSVGTLSSLAISNSTAGIALSISAEPYLPLGTQTWTFRTGTGVGAPTSWISFPDGTNQLTAYTGNAATVTNGVYTTDTGTVTNTMLAGSIANAKLANSSVTVGTTAISLGSSSTTLAGLTSVSSTAFTGALTGNASTATKLATARNINGVAFDGTAAITVTAAAGTLTGSTLASGVTSSSLTSVGTLTGLTSNGIISVNYIGTGTTGSVYIHGLNQKGGANYHDFLSVTNESGSALYPNKYFRLSPTGTLEIRNSNYDTTILSLSDAGVLSIPNTASSANNSASTNYLGIGTRGQMYDDGNLHLHTSSSTLWINSLDSGDIKIGTQYNSGSGSDVYIGKNLAANSGSVTANASTAFIAGANAVSNVSLQMPSESALRNLTNGYTNMYFDVSIGGTTTGGFQFRSGSGYTNFMTLDSNGPKAITTYQGKTPYNSALDTVVTVDNLKYRISNQGGVFPQIASASGSNVDVCYDVLGVVNGNTPASAQNSGYILLANGTWLSIYSTHGMDARGDRVTAHITDKAAGKIYRATFMRTNNSSNVDGYNIVVERII